MIVSQLMHAFPGCHFSVRSVPESWEVCVLHGALEPGMSKWLEDHNLLSKRAVGIDGYIIRWASVGPEHERRVFATIKRFAEVGYQAAKQRRLYNDNELRGFDRQITEFVLWTKEIGL